MGKVKKTVKDNVKKSNNHRVLRAKPAGKVTKKAPKNLGAISPISKKTVKQLKSVVTNQVKIVKDSNSSKIKKNPQDSTGKSIKTVKTKTANKSGGKLKKTSKKVTKNTKKSESKVIEKSKAVLTKKKSNIKVKATKPTVPKKKPIKKQDIQAVKKSKTNTKSKSSSRLKQKPKPTTVKVQESNKSGNVKNKEFNNNKSKDDKNSSVSKNFTSNKNKIQKFKINTALIFNTKNRNDIAVPNIEETTVKSAIKTLFTSKNDKTQIDDESVFLEFSCVKSSETPCTTLCIPLKHSLVKDGGEVCLVVQNMNRENPEEHQETIEHYENLLKLNEITNINTIMTYYQLRTSCVEFEHQSQFVKSSDLLLVDSKSYEHVLMTLRKIVYNINKLPIPVKMDSTGLKERIESALVKTPTYLYPSIDKFVFRIGHLDMSESQICENVFEACRFLLRKFPGGWNNITSASIKTADDEPVTIFDLRGSLLKLKDDETAFETTEEVGLDEEILFKETEGDSEGFAGFEPESKGYETNEDLEAPSTKRLKTMN